MNLISREELPHHDSQFLGRVLDVLFPIGSEVHLGISRVEPLVLANYVDDIVLAKDLCQLGLLRRNIKLLLGLVDLLELLIKAREPVLEQLAFLVLHLGLIERVRLIQVSNTAQQLAPAL